ncbi:MAG: ubiquinone/menaquinone biosynthesis C-methylase UbiE [Verrucomicrobiales bacterium]|jgi:ubiquinone/menaquinone biosynthesis C-methylase UbiE
MSADEHNENHDHEHGHGHEHDQGLKAMLRYLRHAPDMWSSEVNSAVVARIAPQAGETVMDIGAGIGAGTMVASKSGCTVVAIEPTPYMRRVLGIRRLVARVKDRVRIVDGTAEATTVEATSIDAAWAVNTMHHWTNLDDGIAELARVLAHGGRVLLVDEAFDDPAHPDYANMSARRSEEHDHHFHDVDPAVVEAAMITAGLTVTFAGHDQIAGRPAIVVEGTA